MSRISRYQSSIHKFLKDRSSINELSDEYKVKIFDIVKDLDHLPSVLFLTVLSNQGKKNNMSLHGYFMASGIEILNTIITIMENEEFYKKKKDYTTDALIKQLMTLLNLSLMDNLETISMPLQKDKALKIIFKANNILNKKTNEIISDFKFTPTELIKKTDLLKCHFNEKTKEKDKDNIKDKISKLKKIEKEDLINYINKRYGNMGQTALCLSWLLGSGDEKQLPTLEKIGNYFGMIYKIANDFNNLEKSIEYSNNYSTNIVVNVGIQEAFELFMDNKQKFIEGCITLDIYGHTIKEIIDLLESKIDIIIDKTSPDMKSQYTINF